MISGLGMVMVGDGIQMHNITIVLIEVYIYMVIIQIHIYIQIHSLYMVA